MTTDAQHRTNITIGCALLAVLCIYGVAVGPSDISAMQVLKAIAARAFPDWKDVNDGLFGWQETIIWQVRIPRVVTAALVGAALAVCGGVLQGLFRNPLASPDVLGVTAGASLGAAIAIFFGLAATQTLGLSLFAILGACVTIALVYGIAMKGGRAAVATLVLAGVAINSLNGAVRSFILTLALRQFEVGAAIVYWSLGSLEGRTWDHVMLIAPAFVVGYFIIRRQYRELDVLLLGEIHAVSVGVDVSRVRLQLLLTTSALAGVAVAASGGIGFVGLIAPHIVRMLVGPHHRYLIPMSAVAGAITLVGSDLLLRTVFVAFDIPVGALTALLGAPFFVFLLLRRRGTSFV